MDFTNWLDKWNFTGGIPVGIYLDELLIMNSFQYPIDQQICLFELLNKNGYTICEIVLI